MEVITLPDDMVISSEAPSPCNLIFWADNKEVGKLTWDDGELKFEGDAHESAKLFIEHLKELW